MIACEECGDYFEPLSTQTRICDHCAMEAIEAEIDADVERWYAARRAEAIEHQDAADTAEADDVPGEWRTAG